MNKFLIILLSVSTFLVNNMFCLELNKVCPNLKIKSNSNEIINEERMKHNLTSAWTIYNDLLKSCNKKDNIKPYLKMNDLELLSGTSIYQELLRLYYLSRSEMLDNNAKSLNKTEYKYTINNIDFKNINWCMK